MDIKQQLRIEAGLHRPGEPRSAQAQLAADALEEIERLSTFHMTGSRAELAPHMVIPFVSTVNLQRCLRWHPQGIESWSLSDWAVALAGEVGELCNVIKKLNRIRDGLPGNKESPEQLLANLGPEIADVFLYLDLLCRRAGLVLESAVRDKFNATSQRLGFPERL